MIFVCEDCHYEVDLYEGYDKDVNEIICIECGGNMHRNKEASRS